MLLLLVLKPFQKFTINVIKSPKSLLAVVYPFNYIFPLIS